VVRAWRTYLAGVSREYQLIVVDDASEEPWPESLAEPLPHTQVIRHEQPTGVGAALRTGLAAARHPLVLYTDCDSLYQPADLKLFLDVIDQVHLAAGCRPRKTWGRGRCAQFAYRLLVRLGFGVRLRDVDCAFKLFRRTVFDRIPIQSKNGFVHGEILAKANFLGCLMTEVQLPARNRSRPVPELARPSPLRRILKESNRVFHHPDFGPAELPKEGAEPGPSQIPPTP
jgi:glycosyltransferase involved in cell wall biosynthesis